MPYTTKIKNTTASTGKRGVALLTFVLSLIPIIAFLAFAVDLSFLMVQRSLMRINVDKALIAAISYRAQVGYTDTNIDVVYEILQNKVCEEFKYGSYENGKFVCNPDFDAVPVKKLEEVDCKRSNEDNDGPKFFMRMFYNKTADGSDDDDVVRVCAGKSVRLVFAPVVSAMVSGTSTTHQDIIADGEASLDPVIISIIADNSASMKEKVEKDSIHTKAEVLGEIIPVFAEKFNPSKDKINIVTFNTLADLRLPLDRGELGIGFDKNKFKGTGGSYPVSTERQTNIAAGFMTAFVDVYNYLYNLTGVGLAGGKRAQRDKLGNKANLVWILFTDGAPNAGLFNYAQWNYSYGSSRAIDLNAPGTIFSDEIMTGKDERIEKKSFVPLPSIPLDTPPNVSETIQRLRARASVNNYVSRYITEGFLNYKISLVPGTYEQSVSLPFGKGNVQINGQISFMTPIINPEQYKSGTGGVLDSKTYLGCSSDHRDIVILNTDTDTYCPPALVGGVDTLCGPVVTLVKKANANAFGLSNSDISKACLVGGHTFNGEGCSTFNEEGCLPLVSTVPSVPAGSSAYYSYSGGGVNLNLPAMNFCVPDCTWKPLLDSDGKNIAEAIQVDVRGLDKASAGDDEFNTPLKAYQMLSIAWAQFLRSLKGAVIGNGDDGIKITNSKVFTVGLGERAPLPPYLHSKAKNSAQFNEGADVDIWQDINDDVSRKDILLLNIANDYGVNGGRGAETDEDGKLGKLFFDTKNAYYGTTLASSGEQSKMSFCYHNDPDNPDDKSNAKYAFNKNECGEYFPIRTSDNMRVAFDSIAKKIQMSLIK